MALRNKASPKDCHRCIYKASESDVFGHNTVHCTDAAQVCYWEPPFAPYAKTGGPIKRHATEEASRKINSNQKAGQCPKQDKDYISKSQLAI